MRISLLFLPFIVAFGVSAQEPFRIHSDQYMSATADERAECIDVSQTEYYVAGEFNVNTGTDSLKFCYNGVCGGTYDMNTNSVVDFVSVTYESRTSPSIGVGNSGYPWIESLSAGDTRFVSWNDAMEHVYLGPIYVSVTEEWIIVTKLENGEHGDLYMDINLNGEFVVTIISNRDHGTNWTVAISPKVSCPDYVESQTFAICTSDTVKLEAPCPNDFMVWTDQFGDTLCSTATLTLSPPVLEGFYYWNNQCQQGYFQLIDIDSVDINVLPYWCTDSTRLSVTGNIPVSWSNGDSSTSVIVPEGSYWATIYSYNGCSKTTDTLVLEGVYHDAELIVDIISPAQDTVATFGTPIMLEASMSHVDTVQSANVTWFRNGVYLPSGILGDYYASSGHIVAVATLDACLDSAFVLLSTDYYECNFGVYQPNCFSPSSINGNHEFAPLLPQGAKLLQFKVYDRWGSLVHDSPNPWGGTANGEMAIPGVYVWWASAVLNGIYLCRDGVWGEVTLIR